MKTIFQSLMTRLRIIFKVNNLKDNLLSVINLVPNLQLMKVIEITKIQQIK